ncbi:MAG TPA: hypothetical protein VJK52_02725 [Candidatus Nanoarchaeia archaeon]|nr:hypothetical protein [Candidatus Nanoarchaeia archaeon]
MKKRLTSSIALWQLYLILSISFIGPGISAQADPALVITLDVPATTNRESITVHGMTRGNARVFVKANGAVSQTDFDASAVASSQGNFLVSEIPLQNGQNTLAVLAVDGNGNTGTAAAEVLLDRTEPSVQLDEFDGIQNTTSITLMGQTNEAGMVSYTITSNGRFQTQAPQAFNTSAGQFSISPGLENGENIIEFRFTDIAGNAIELRRIVRIDTADIRILEHNLDQLDPSYSQEVVVRGKVSKPGAEVVVFVNGETNSDGSWSTSLIQAIRHLGSVVLGNRNYQDKADEDGTFRVPVLLRQSISEREQQTRIDGYEPLEGAGRNREEYSTRPLDSVRSPFLPDREFENEIKIIAMDDAGHTAESGGVITFAKCGSGGDWNVKVGQISPAIITPELLRLGLAQFAFDVELTYQGLDESANLVAPPFIRPYELNEQISKDSAIDPRRLVTANSIVPHWDEDDNYRHGFIVVNLNAHNYTQQKLKDLDLRDLRIRIPLQLELNYENEFQGERLVQTQRQCWDVFLGLDVEVPLDKIPKQLLNQSIQAIDALIDGIDAVRKPLRIISTVTLVACIGSWFVLFMARVQERYQCKIGELFSDGSRPDMNADEQNQCKEAKKRRIAVEQKLQLICDRTFCPSAPTISYHMRKSPIAECRSYSVHNYADTNAAQAREASRKLLAEYDIEDFFLPDNSLGYAAPPPGVTTEQLCLYDYFDQWDTSCMMMNELEQSRCVELGNDYCPKGIKNLPNRFAGICGKKAVTGEERAICTSARDAAGGECYYQDKQGNWYLATEVRETRVKEGKVVSTGEQVVGIQNAATDFGGTTVYYDVNGIMESGQPTDGEGALGVHAGALYQSPIFIGPNGHRQVRSTDIDNTKIISIGSKETYQWKKGVNVQIDSSGQTYVNTCSAEEIARLGIRPDCWVPATLSDPEFQQYWRPLEYFSAVGGETVSSDRAARTGAPLRAPNQILQQNPQNENYAVEPSSGFIRAVQCVCLPGIMGYLTLWRNILEQVKLCFRTILLTGQGKSGVCRAVLTIYVCDLVVDAIKCFVKKYGPSEHAARDRKATSRFLGALQGAGRDIHNSIVDRYGQSNLYQAMFNERKLIHQACLFAFTGDYDLDIDALLSTGAGVPIRSEGFLFPHTRRFLNFNPLDGKANFVYHVGVGLAAGAKLNYNVELVCSNDLSCNPLEGFSGGRCDCYGGAERSVPITSSFETLGQPGALPGQLDAGEVLGGEQGDLYKLINADVRYDRVRLSWTWTENGQTKTEHIERKISQDGSAPPVECQFDLTALSFSCRTVIGRRGTARFLQPPKVTDPYYYLGEPITLSFLGEKRSPGSGQSQAPVPKILCAEVHSDSRAGKYPIADAKNPHCVFLMEDGQFDAQSASIGGTFTEVIVEEADILGYAAGTVLDYRAEHLPVSVSTVGQPLEYCASAIDLGIFRPTGTTLNEISFRPEDFRVEPGTPPQEWILVVESETLQNINIAIYHPQPLGGGKYCVPKSGTTVAAIEQRIEVPLGSTRLTFRNMHIPLPPRLSAGDAMVVRYLPPREGTAPGGPNVFTCDDFASKTNAADWIVEVKLLNPKALDKDKPLSATNYDPNVLHNDGIVTYQGQKQEYRVPIKVLCAAKGAEGPELCATNRRAENECICDPARKSRCAEGEYCMHDNRFAGGEYTCAGIDACPLGLPISTDNSEEGFCDCDGSPLNDAEYCLGGTCKYDPRFGTRCEMPTTRGATSVSGGGGP